MLYNTFKDNFKRLKKRTGKMKKSCKEIKEELVMQRAKEMWLGIDTFYCATSHPERAKAIESFLKNEFFPLLKKTDNVAEFACAEGEYTLMVAPHVNKIDAFDLSERFILKAKKRMQENGITNVNFVGNGVDVTTFTISEKYDAFVCLGLFSYIPERKKADHVVEQIAGSLSKGSPLVLNDKIWKGKTRLHLKKKLGAISRSKEEYLSLFEKDFEVLKAVTLQECDQFEGFACIMVKK